MTGTSRKNFVRSGICFALVLLLVFCPLFQIRASAASLEDIALIVWSALSGCGIRLVGSASSVVDFIIDELTDFAESTQQTLTDVVYGLKYSVNSLGEFIVNDIFVDTINDFIGFLTGKYDIDDNEVVEVVSSATTLDGLDSYLLPLYLDTNDGWDSEYYVFQASAPVYGIFYKQFPSGSMSHYLGIGLWSTEPAVVNCIAYRPNGTVSATFQPVLVETADNGIYWYEFQSITIYDSNTLLSGYTIYEKETVHTAFTSLAEVVPGSDPVYAYSTTIIAPTTNITYTTGDGAVINIGSDWGDTIYDLFDHIRRLIGNLSNQMTIYYRSMQQIEDQVPPASDVTNLPSGSIYHINGLLQDSNGEGGLRFDGIWHYVTSWVEDFSEAAPIIWYCVTSCPDPIVNMVYAVTVITVVIGFIHKARSH